MQPSRFHVRLQAVPTLLVSRPTPEQVFIDYRISWQGGPVHRLALTRAEARRLARDLLDLTRREARG